MRKKKKGYPPAHVLEPKWVHLTKWKENVVYIMLSVTQKNILPLLEPVLVKN